MKLLIIDDDALVCASLKTILETDPQVKVVGTGGSGREAVSLYRRLRPDVLLMDIRMDGLTGLEAGELILREAPEAKILFLTTFSDDEYIIKALKLGAKGYLIKQNFESILPALHAVESGQSVFGSEIVTKLPELMQSAGVTEALKASDPMKWVGLMNTLKAQAEEVIFQELIYA